MDPLSITAGIIAVVQLTSSLLEYLNSVKDAPKERAQCAIEASSLYNLMTMLRYRTEECESRSNEAWYNSLKSLSAQGGPIDQHRHALEKLLERASGKPGTWKLGDSIRWAFRKEDVRDLLMRIERLKTVIGIALEMDHFKLSQAIKADIQLLQDGADDIKVDTDAIRKALPTIEDRLQCMGDMRRGDQVSEVAEWTSSADFGPQQADLIAGKQEGTGLWFLESPLFTTWLEGLRETLFCPGIPGAGKTMIAAITVDHLLRTMPAGSVGVAFLYCNYKDDTDVTGAGLLAAILKQLLLGQTSVPKGTVDLYRGHTSRGTRPSVEDISDALLSVLSTYSRTYIIIDALDECPNNQGARTQLVRELRSLQSKADVCIMATSRFLPDIQGDFANVPTLEIRARDADIQRYLDGQIHRLPRCVQHDDELKKLVLVKIAEAVDGMFLLARLYLDSLLDKRTKAKVRATLQSLSRGSHALDNAYRGAIERMEGQLPEDRALAKMVITWIVCSEWPLHRDALCHALAVSEGDTTLDRDNIPDVADLLSVCAGLVTLDEERDVIRLVHYTTQEFFEGIGHHWLPDAQRMMAVTCLTYLRLDHTKISWSDTSNEDAWPGHLLLYAVSRWAQHARTVQAEVADIALPYLMDQDRDVRVGPIFRLVTSSLGHLGRDTWSGVHCAAFFGLEMLLKLVLGRVAASEVDATASKGHTPLLLAVSAGHEGVVKVLLKHGADVNGGRRPRKPLSYAAEAGHEHIVKLLLSRDGLDLNLLDEQPFIMRKLAALHYAVSRGHAPVVRLLLQDTRLNVNLQSLTQGSKQGHTALGLAVERNDVDMVRLLLSHAEIDPNVQGQDGISALSQAVSKGYKDLATLLLKHPGVETGRRDDCGRLPLWHAVFGGHCGIVEFLMDHADADSETHGNWAEMLLSAAAAGGHSDVVDLFRGCSSSGDLNLRDARGETILWKAASSGRAAVVRLLLEKTNADPNMADNDGFTPILCAALQGHTEVVRVMVDCKNVDTNAQSNIGLSPLLVSAVQGHEDIVRLLLECRTTDPNLADPDGTTPLSAAISQGHDAVADLLRQVGNMEDAPVQSP